MQANSPIVDVGSMRIIESSLLREWLMDKLSEEREGTRGFRLNGLPRKAALEHASVGDDEQESAGEGTLVSLEREGSKGAQLALRFGARGAFVHIPVALRSLRGMVTTYRGSPTLLRATRFATMVERHRLAETMTHYFDRLAFECALAGQEKGRLVLYYECLPGEKFMVYDLWFRDLPAIADEAERRLRLLEAGAPPEQLPPGPAWMAKFCRFAERCGCAHAPESERIVRVGKSGSCRLSSRMRSNDVVLLKLERIKE